MDRSSNFDCWELYLPDANAFTRTSSRSSDASDHRRDLPLSRRSLQTRFSSTSHCGRNLDTRRASVFHITLRTASADLVWTQRYKCGFCGEQGARNTARQIKHLTNECKAIEAWNKSRQKRILPRSQSDCSPHATLFMIQGEIASAPTEVNMLSSIHANCRVLDRSQLEVRC